MGLLSAIFSGFIAALVSYVVCCRKNYISTITKERTKWLTKLRDDCALLICKLENTNKNSYLKNNMSNIVNLKCQCYKIILQLNPKKEKEIIKTLSEIETNYLNGNKNIDDLITYLSSKFPKILKNTWEEIKNEARPWYVKVFINLKNSLCHCNKTDKSS